MSADKIFLKDYVYELKPYNSSTGKIYLTVKSKLFLVINGNTTTIPIENLFLKQPEIDSEDISGYSILQILSGSKLKIDDTTILDILIEDKSTGTRYSISKIRKPFIYDRDLEIAPAQRLQYIDLLLSHSFADSPRVPATPEPSADELKAIADAQAKLEAQQRLLELEEENKKIIGGGHWEKEREYLLKQGAKEYAHANYRFFYKPSTDTDEALVAFFELEPGDYHPIDLYEDDITDESEIYSYDDKNDNEHIITFNKVNDSIAVL